MQNATNPTVLVELHENEVAVLSLQGFPQELVPQINAVVLDHSRNLPANVLYRFPTPTGKLSSRAFCYPVRVQAFEQIRHDDEEFIVEPQAVAQAVKRTARFEAAIALLYQACNAVRGGSDEEPIEGDRNDRALNLLADAYNLISEELSAD